MRSLIAMAHNLGVGIIAEGVETAEQARFLSEERCEEAQGFLYAKPLPAADFEAYLASHPLARDTGLPLDKEHHRSGNVRLRGGGGEGAGTSVRPASRRRPRV